MALDTVVVADAGAPAYLALAPAAVMLAYLRPATLLALALDTVVVADAGAPAYLARSLDMVVWADTFAPAIFARLRWRLWGHFFAGGRGMSCFIASPIIRDHQSHSVLGLVTVADSRTLGLA